MTSPNTTTGWNPTTTGSNFTYINKGTYSHHPDSQHNNLTKEEMLILRDEYYRVHYKRETGTRIALTLGGFFLFVLLTLWYKSKCKKHHRDPTPIPHLDLSQLPSSPLPRYGGGSSEGDEDRMAMLDPSHFINMNQIHPYNHYPLPNNQNNTHRYVNSPAVLLTAANSESSEEDLSSAGLTSGGGGGMGPLKQPLRPLINPHLPTIHHLNPDALPPQQMGQNNKRQMKWLQQNIDIHVILPTPTISPSGSEHFCTREVPLSPLFPVSRRGSNYNAAPNSSASDRDRSSSVGSTSYASGGGGFANNPLFFLENLKYVDDTSSENIPTIEDPDQDTRSIGSDSVFAGFEHNFDHVAPSYGRRVSSVSGYGIIGYPSGAGACPGQRVSGDEEESDFKLTLTQAQAQVHHRDSFCSEVESLNDYLESHRRRSSSTQTTFSDLQQCLSLSCSSGTGPGAVTIPGRYSPHLSPHTGHSGSFKKGIGQLGPRQVGYQNPGLLSVSGPQGNRVNHTRKMSFEGLKKPHSLQCDEPISCSTNNSPGK